MRARCRLAGKPPSILLTQLTLTIALSWGLLGLGAAHPANSLPTGISSKHEPSPAGFARITDSVLPVLARAERIANARRDDELTLTVTLKRDDQKGFEQFLRDVYEPFSPRFRQYLSQAQLAEQFGPSLEIYDRLQRFLQSSGLALISSSANRLTLTVRGTRRQVERAFALRIEDYRLGDIDFYANDAGPALPRSLAAHVQSVAGLSNLARPRASNAALYTFGRYLCKQAYAPPNTKGTPSVDTNADARAKCISSVKDITKYDGAADTDPPGWEELNGAGQTIGLIEFDTYEQSDIANFLNLIGYSASLPNVSEVNVGGGASPGPDQDEVLLDIDTVVSIAPGAKVVVYEGPFNGQGSFQALFNAAINSGSTIISNSWSYCEDETTLADVQSIDSIFANAAASGISIFNGAGDSGSTCLDGAANTIGVPADSPHATAVGGSSLSTGPGNTYSSETWWNGIASNPRTGQGGFGVSRFFSIPIYQVGLTAAAMRSIPDVVANADPAQGVEICQQANGGCPSGLSYGGTSMSAPAWAAFAAVLDQALGKKVGAFNQAIYPFAGTTAFHTAASMGSDFAHVGLGSPNLNQLYLKLSGQTTGAASPTYSGLFSYVEAPLYSVTSPFADGSTPGYVNVRLLDGNGNPTPGKAVKLSAGTGSHATITPSSAVTSINDGTAVFTITDTVPETLTLTATDTTDGVVIVQPATLSFAVPPAAGGGISVNPPSVTADGVSAATITVTLKDATGKPTPQKSVSIQDGSAHAVITGPASGVTDVNGQIQFSATDQVDETVTFTAIDVTDGNLPVPGSGTVTYSNSQSNACNVNSPPVAASGYTITPYITGFPTNPYFYYGGVNFGCSGAVSPAFVSSGSVLTPDFATGNVYVTPLSGGAVTSANILSNIGLATNNLVIGKDGNWYATQSATTGNFTTGDLVQVNPATGQIVRVVASNLTCPGNLAVDPLSGDLFFDDTCTGDGSDNPSIFRVVDPSNSNPSQPTAVVVYATLPTTPNGGLAFAPDGTLFAVTGYYGVPNAQVVEVSATNSPRVSVAALDGITSDYALAIGATNTDGSAQSLIVEPAGTLEEVPIADPAAATILATVSPGVGVGGPDGCLYSARYDTVYRLANSSGDCTFAPTNPNPSIKLSPPSSTTAAQGSTQTLTATVHNVTPLSGTAVIFVIKGANPQFKLVNTDTTGKAALTYTGTLTGNDTVTATATTSNGTALMSNSVLLSWTPGKHATFLSLNLSPGGGMLGQPVTVTASLSDVTTQPGANVAGQTINFTLGSSSCSAVTTSSGTASCSLTPSQTGTLTLTASFAATSGYVASTASAGFRVVKAPTAPGLVAVPNVVGLAQPAASTAITGAKLVLGTVTQQSSFTILPGIVLSQKPTAGGSVATGSSVSLVTSSGSTCADLEIVKAAFGSKRGQPAYNPLADVNNDGLVNVADLSLVARALPAGTVCN